MTYECIVNKLNLGDQNECVDMKILDIEPDRYQMFAPYPNPFNPITSLSFYLQTSEYIILQIVDINGRVVETPIRQYIAGGYHTIKWNASAYPSGVYLIRMMRENSSIFRKDEMVQAKKIVLIK